MGAQQRVLWVGRAYTSTERLGDTHKQVVRAGWATPRWPAGRMTSIKKEERFKRSIGARVYVADVGEGVLR